MIERASRDLRDRNALNNHTTSPQNRTPTSALPAGACLRSCAWRTPKSTCFYLNLTSAVTNPADGPEKRPPADPPPCSEARELGKPRAEQEHRARRRPLTQGRSAADACRAVFRDSNGRKRG